jgi:hypothetical protein
VKTLWAILTGEFLNMPTQRINFTLFDDDIQLINSVRDKYESEQGKRLAYAEVVRLALKQAVIVDSPLQPR